MPTSHNISIIYGFKADNPITRDRKTGAAGYLWDWLQEHYPELSQHNAGVSNGGNPEFFVGVKVAEIRDYTRHIRPYLPLPEHLPSPHQGIVKDIVDAFRALKAIDPDLVGAETDIGFFMIGDAA